MSSDVELDGVVNADDEDAVDHTSTVEGGAPPLDLSHVLAEVQGLREIFESKIRYDEVRARQVEALHGELEQYRRGLTQEFLRPVLTDLVRLHDDLAVHAEAGDEGSRPDGAARIAAYVRGSIEETLARSGVEAYTVDEPAVDRRLQKVIGVLATGDPALHRTVAKRARLGFRFDDKILRPEWVHAYQFEPPASEPDERPASTGADDVKESH